MLSMLGLWLRERWERSQLSQVEFVRGLGLDIDEIGKQTISKIVNGRQRAPMKLIQALSNGYEVTTEHLLGLQDQPASENSKPPPLAKPELDSSQGGVPSRERLSVLIAEHERKRDYHANQALHLTWIRDNYDAFVGGLKVISG